MRIAVWAFFVSVGLSGCATSPHNLSESLVGLASNEQSYCHAGDTDPACQRLPYRRCRHLGRVRISDPDAACQWPVWPPRPLAASY
jgi:hypothetical protein